MSAQKSTLVFIPFPQMSHLTAEVKAAKLLADRDDRLFISVLIMKLPISDIDITCFTNNPSYSRINFVQLPENKSSDDSISQMKSQINLVPLIASQRGVIEDAVAEIIETQKMGSSNPLFFIVDIFCVPMIDLAKELGSPAYLFFTSGAASLGLMYGLQSFADDENEDLLKYENSDAVIPIPTYVNSVPAKVWPSAVFANVGLFLYLSRKFREVDGIIVNTFLEFENHAIQSLSSDEKIPPIYPVGPIIQVEKEESDEKQDGIIRWLDEQPDDSVVFLCFGTAGYFSEDQVKEIAAALQSSGHRFLWSLRKPPPSNMGSPGEYENPEEVLPEGFLDDGIGKVIGWAPQMAVLSHRAVGGFVSHCGWNSILESVWFGVPMAVWPLAAEQQLNAFQLVKDFEMAVEIKIDYRKNSDVIVPGEKIEKAIRDLMDPDNMIRVRVNELKVKIRKVLEKGGSSHDFLGRLVDNFLHN